MEKNVIKEAIEKIKTNKEELIKSLYAAARDEMVQAKNEKRKFYTGIRMDERDLYDSVFFDIRESLKNKGLDLDKSRLSEKEINKILWSAFENSGLLDSLE